MSLKKLANQSSKAIRVQLKSDEGLFLVERHAGNFECILADVNCTGNESYFIELGKITGFRFIGDRELFNRVKGFGYDWLTSVVRTVFLNQAKDIFYYPNEGVVKIPKGESNNISQSASSSVEPVNSKVKKKQVLIIDDSMTIQKLLRRIISESKILEVMDVASCPSEAKEIIEKNKPDLITLDIHMPEMTGVEFLKTYLGSQSIPVVMISSVSISEGPLVMEALSSGAQSYIQKPSLQDVHTISKEILEKLENLAGVKISRLKSNKKASISVDQFSDTNGLIVMGASTGGTQTLESILTSLPDTVPPIVIVQHIPAVFSKALADRLNGLCTFNVKEAEDGDYIQKDKVYIAPGGFQCCLKNGQGRYRISINEDDPVNRFRPSVDYLFNSVAKLPIANRVAVILTGMGDDGARGMLKLFDSGVKTLAQDEKSCVVFGMPKEAIKLGGVEHILDLDKIPNELVNVYNFKKRKVA